MQNSDWHQSNNWNCHRQMEWDSVSSAQQKLGQWKSWGKEALWKAEKGGAILSGKRDKRSGKGSQ